MITISISTLVLILILEAVILKLDKLLNYYILYRNYAIQPKFVVGEQVRYDNDIFIVITVHKNMGLYYYYELRKKYAWWHDCKLVSEIKISKLTDFEKLF